MISKQNAKIEMHHFGGVHPWKYHQHKNRWSIYELPHVAVCCNPLSKKETKMKSERFVLQRQMMQSRAKPCQSRPTHVKLAKTRSRKIVQRLEGPFEGKMGKKTGAKRI